MSDRPPEPDSYGDVRDVLAGLPFPPNDATSYALTDLFTVRHEIIRGLDPAPRSVFEFGALLGFFLVTALDALDYDVDLVAWVDNELHTPGSNRMCFENVRSVAERVQCWGGTSRDDLQRWLGVRADLVQVDSDHSRAGCYADLVAARRLDPSWIMVDDWTADAHVDEVQAATNDWLADELQHGRMWRVDEHKTVNGLAVLTRET